MSLGKTVLISSDSTFSPSLSVDSFCFALTALKLSPMSAIPGSSVLAVR